VRARLRTARGARRTAPYGCRGTAARLAGRTRRSAPDRPPAVRAAALSGAGAGSADLGKPGGGHAEQADPEEPVGRGEQFACLVATAQLLPQARHLAAEQERAA